MATKAKGRKAEPQELVIPVTESQSNLLAELQKNVEAKQREVKAAEDTRNIALAAVVGGHTVPENAMFKGFDPNKREITFALAPEEK